MGAIVAETDVQSNPYLKSQMRHFESNRVVSTLTDRCVAPRDVSASPEEGAALIRAFLRVKQREVRASIIELTERLST